MTRISNHVNHSTFTTGTAIPTYASDIITTTKLLIKTSKCYYHKYFSLQRGFKTLALAPKFSHDLGHSFTNYTDHLE